MPYFPAKSITSNKFLTPIDRRRVSTDYPHKIGLKESNGDAMSGLKRSLAAEIHFPPLSTNEKALTSKRLKMNEKCLRNTNRKPWPLYNLMTSFPVLNDPNIGHNRRSKKNAYDFRMVLHARQQM